MYPLNYQLWLTHNIWKNSRILWFSGVLSLHYPINCAGMDLVSFVEILRNNIFTPPNLSVQSKSILTGKIRLTPFITSSSLFTNGLIELQQKILNAIVYTQSRSVVFQNMNT